MVDSLVTSQRLLDVLDVLERTRTVTSAQLSQEFQVSERTVRRDILRLRELGFRVEASQGVGGGYSLRRGRHLPQLLLNETEMVQLGTADPATVQKLQAQLPTQVKTRVDSLHQNSVRLTSATPHSRTLLDVAEAIRNRCVMRFGYKKTKEIAYRRAAPHRLVSYAHLWYLQAFDIDRNDWRTFRIDRIGDVELLHQHFHPREDLPSADTVRGGPRPALTWPHQIEVEVFAPVKAVQAEIPSSFIEYEEADSHPDHTILRTSTDDLNSACLHLLHLPWGFRIIRPVQLVDCFASLAQRLQQLTPQPATSSSANLPDTPEMATALEPTIILPR